jgi:hypothetical protein
VRGQVEDDTHVRLVQAKVQAREVEIVELAELSLADQVA